jgi:RHS repeat-associated protein
MVKTIAPDLSETLYTPIGSELTITDPANRKTKQKKDAFGRLTSVTEDPGGTLQSTTNYRYSVQDDLLAVCQGGVFSGATCVGGKERTFRYDSLRRLASATNPESGETLYTYDDAGNLTTKRDGNMISVNTTYDAIQRPLVRTYSDGTTPEVTYTWDLATLNGIGRMNRVANSISTTDYLEFDAMGRVLKSRQTTNTTPYNFEYQYNLAGGMSLEKYPSLREVRSCYDEAGRISQVRQKANATAPETVVANLTGYAPHGAVTGMTLGPSLVTETTLHDPKRLQVQQLTASTVVGGNWQMNLYYCAGESLLCTTNNGNIVRQKGYGGAAWDYSYDSLNRLELTTEKVGTVDKWQQRMKYDPFGNRWILNEAGTLIPNLEATPRAQLASDPSPFTTKNQWNGASYDPGGNQTTTWGDGTAVGAAKYFYDAENRIKKAEVNWPAGGAGVVEHGYDGDGRRIWKKVGGVVKTTFVYNAAGQLVAEYGESAAMPCTTCYLTADHLGSTRVVWGSDGAMKQLLDYAPFGEEVGANYRGGDVRYPGGLYPRPGGMGVSMEFTGKERDAETGLDYFEARYMSSAQGRFTSPDVPLLDQKPEHPQTWNLYVYARNNPLRFIDPTGKCVKPAVKEGETGVCIDLFIASPTIGGVGYGDNRGPAPNDPNATYRQEILLAIDPAKGTVRTVKDDAGTSTFNLLGLEFSSKGSSITEVTQLSEADKSGNRTFSVATEGLNGMAGLPLAPKDTIKTQLDFVVTGEGKVGLEGGMRTAYPSIEVYRYDQRGKAIPIYRNGESGNPGDLCCQNQPIPKVRPR